MTVIKENEVVALLKDMPEQGLRRGDVGTVIEVFTANAYHPAGFIVEFVDAKGSVCAQADITDANCLMPLRFSLQLQAA